VILLIFFCYIENQWCMLSIPRRNTSGCYVHAAFTI